MNRFDFRKSDLPTPGSLLPSQWRRGFQRRAVMGGLAALPVLATFACGSPAPTLDGSSGSGGVSSDGSGGAAVGGTSSSGATDSGGTDSGGTGSGGTGSGGTPDGGGGLDDYEIVPCALTTSRSEVSPDIETVGIVEFTTDLAGASGGFIQFGKTTDYTLTAPIDWAASGHKTLLLGMPANTELHYRIVATAGTSACLGPDTVLETGSLPNGGPPPSVTPTPGSSSAAIEPGFIVTSGGLGGFGPYAIVVNTEGEVVWSYKFAIEGDGLEGVIRAHMSWDGKSMLARDLNLNGDEDRGRLFKVGLDGTGETSVVLSTSHHDFTVIPDGVAYIARAGATGDCDAIHTASEDGTNDQVILDLWPVLEPFDNGMGTAGACHVNAIHYYADEDAFTVSDRERDMLVKFNRQGEVLWTIGASPASITGADIPEWRVQHGHHLYEPDKLLVFSNGAFTDGSSHVLHFTIDGTTATSDWNYADMGDTGTLGDVQKLPGGNVLITVSQTGVIQEIDEDNAIVQTMVFDGLGYSNHRPTLYGEPAPR